MDHLPFYYISTQSICNSPRLSTTANTNPSKCDGDMAIAKYSREYLQQLASDPSSSVQLKKSFRKVLLQPWHIGNPSGAITEILNLSLCKYDPALGGLILGYEKPQRLGDTAPCGLDSSQFSVRIQAEFYVFRPKIGNIYQGVVIKTSVAHVGCLLYNHFNVSLPIPPQKVHLLKTLTPKSEVTFELEELNLTSELPFFRGQLLEVKSKCTDQSAKKEKQENQDAPGISPMVNMVKHDAPALGKVKKDSVSQLAMVKSQRAADVLDTKMSDRHSKLSLKREGSENAKPDKKKRLSLKQIQSDEGNKGETCEDYSNHFITPNQPEPVNRGVSKLDERRVSLKPQTFESFCTSPLDKVIERHKRDDLSDTPSDLQTSPTFGYGKSSQNSLFLKTSQSKKKMKVNSQRVDVQSKSQGVKNIGSGGKDDSSSEDDKSSSENSAERRIEFALQLTPTKQTSPQKGKNTPIESLRKTKDKAQKSPQVEVQSKSPRDNSGSQTPLKKVPAADDSSSEDDKSSSGGSEEHRKLPSQIFTKQTLPLKGKSQVKSQKSGSATDVQSKNQGGENNGSQVPNVKNVLVGDSSSEDDSSSSSGDSEERRKLLPQTFTKQSSPLKGKSQVKSQKSGSATDVQSKNQGGENNGSQVPNVKNVRVGDSSSEDDSSSSSGDSEERRKLLPQTFTKQSSPLKGKSQVKSQKSGSATDVQSKYPGGENNGSQVPNVKNVQVSDSSSEDDEKSSSDDSEGYRKKHVTQKLLSSPQKGKSTHSKVKARSQKLESVLSLAKLSKSQESHPVLPLKNLSKENVLSSEDDKSSSENSENKGFPKRDSPIATSTQKSPQQKLPLPNLSGAKLAELSSSDSSDDEDKNDSSSSEDSDSDTNAKHRKLELSRIVTRAGATREVANPAEESSSEDSDAHPQKKDEESSDSEDEVPKTSTQTLLRGDLPQRSTAPANYSSSDSEFEVRKTPGQVRPGDARTEKLTAEQSSSDSDVSEIAARTPPGNARSGRPTAPAEQSSAGSSKPKPSTPHLREDTSSDSESDGKTAASSHVQRRSPTKPPPDKVAVLSGRKSLSQTFLAGSLQNPLASSTPTVESAKPSFKNLDMQNRKRPYSAEINEPVKKKGKSSKKHQPKLGDSVFGDLKEKMKKKKDTKLSKKVNKERSKEGQRLHRESDAAYTKKRKKLKEKIDIESASVSNTQGGVCEPVEHSKHKKDSLKTKAGIQSVETQDNVGDLGKKQVEVVTSKNADVLGRVKDDADRKSKKRKRTEEKLEKGSSMDRDLQREEKVLKKRKLSPALDERNTVRDVSSKGEKFDLKNHSSKPKKSRKNKERGFPAKPEEPDAQFKAPVVKSEKSLPSKRKDVYSEGGIVTTKPLVSGTTTLTGSREKVDDHLRDCDSNRVFQVVRNPLLDDNCDIKKKKKKSKKADAGVTVKSIRDDVPPIESIQMVSRKDKKVKEKADAKCEDDLRTSVDIQAVSKPRSGKSLDSEKKLKKMEKRASTLAPEPVRQRSPTLSPVFSKKEEKIAEQVYSGEDFNSEKQSKKKEEKLSYVTPGPARVFSPPLPVDSALSSKKKTKKKSAELRQTEDESKSEKKSKKKEEHYFTVLGSVRDLSPSLSVASAEFSKKKKTSEHVHSEESKSEKKSKKKEQHFALPGSVRELSPLSVASAESSKKKKTSEHVHSEESKSEKKSKKKEHFALPGSVRELPPFSVASAESSKKKKTSEHVHTEEEYKSAKKSNRKRKSKDKSSVVPEAARELSAPFTMYSSVSANSKRTADSMDSLDLKVSVKKTKKKGKEQKVKAQLNQVSADVGYTSVDLSNLVDSLIKNIKSEDDQKKTKN